MTGHNPSMAEAVGAGGFLHVVPGCFGERHSFSNGQHPRIGLFRIKLFDGLLGLLNMEVCLERSDYSLIQRLTVRRQIVSEKLRPNICWGEGIKGLLVGREVIHKQDYMPSLYWHVIVEASYPFREYRIVELRLLVVPVFVAEIIGRFPSECPWLLRLSHKRNGPLVTAIGITTKAERASVLSLLNALEGTDGITPSGHLPPEEGGLVEIVDIL